MARLIDDFGSRRPSPRKPARVQNGRPPMGLRMPQPRPVAPRQAVNQPRAPRFKQEEAPLYKPTLPGKRMILAMVCLVIALFGGFALFRQGPAETNSSEVDVPAAAPPPLDPIQTAEMDATITQLIADNPQLDIGVSWLDIKTGDRKHYGEDAQFIAASVSKVLTATYFLSLVEEGEMELTGTNAMYLRLMIEDSDQTAWEQLNGMLGKPALQEYGRSIGMESYESLDNKMMTEDVILLLQKLQTGKLINQEHTDLLLGHMERAGERQYIVEGVNNQAKVYHKAGYLRDRAHDAAIIDNGDRPYVLVIFTKSRFGDYDFAAGSALIQEITTATTKAFFATEQ